METTTPNSGNLGTMGTGGKATQAADRAPARSIASRKARTKRSIASPRRPRHCSTAHERPRPMRKTRYMQSTTTSWPWRKSGRSRHEIKSAHTRLPWWASL